MVEADSREPGAEEFLRQFTLGRAADSRGRFSGWKPAVADISRTFRRELSKFMFRAGTTSRFTRWAEISNCRISKARWICPPAGGNITAGRVDALATGVRQRIGGRPRGTLRRELETLGGHITIGDVAGTLRATTSGGHITTGNISGDGILHTGGGQIRTGRISGVATLETGGGNIHVEKRGFERHSRYGRRTN